MLLTHRALASPVGLISAIRSGMWGIFGLNKGEGSSKDAPKTGFEETQNAPNPN